MAGSSAGRGSSDRAAATPSRRDTVLEAAVHLGILAASWWFHGIAAAAYLVAAILALRVTADVGQHVLPGLYGALFVRCHSVSWTVLKALALGGYGFAAWRTLKGAAGLTSTGVLYEVVTWRADERDRAGTWGADSRLA